MNKAKTKLNIAVSILSQAVIMILGIVVPRIILVNYGSDTNGFTNTITQVFSYLVLLEAGIGAATRNVLFKPLADDNKADISKWVYISKRYYKISSLIYLSAVIVSSFIFPLVIKSEIYYFTMAFYILFEGFANVVVFYFAGTWSCLLNSDGKSYVVNFITLITKILGHSARIVLALLKANIIFIQIAYFVISVVSVLLYFAYVKKRYPWLKNNNMEVTEKLPQKTSYLVTEIAWTVFSSTDMIVLSIFISSSMASVYSIYNMVFVAINAVISSIYTSIQYNLGQYYFTDIEKYKKMHSSYHSIFLSAVTAAMCVTYLLIIPFVRLYTSGVNDINYIIPYLPLFFCLIQILSWSRYVSGNLSGIAGYAKRVSVVSAIEASINIILSIILVLFFGIYGVLIATVIALPLKVIYLNILCDKKILKRNPMNSFAPIIANVIIFGITVFIERFTDFGIDSYFAFLQKGIALSVLFVVIVLIINNLVNPNMMKQIMRKKYD